MLKCFRKLEVTQSSSTQVSKTHSQCDVIDIHMKVLGALLWTTPGTALVFKTLTRYLRNPVLATRQNRWNMDESFTEVGDRHVTPTQNGAHRWQNFSNEISFTKTLQNTDVRDMNTRHQEMMLWVIAKIRLVLSNILFNMVIFQTVIPMFVLYHQKILLTQRLANGDLRVEACFFLAKILLIINLLNQSSFNDSYL